MMKDSFTAVEGEYKSWWIYVAFKEAVILREITR